MRIERESDVFDATSDDLDEEVEGTWDEWDELDEPETEEGSEPVTDPADPARLREQRFILSLFGYDRGEVRAFLSYLADRLERSSPEVPAAAPAASFEALGEEVTRILKSTTEAAESIRRKLTSEAERARDEATERLARATEDAEANARAITGRAEERAKALIAEAERHSSEIVRDAEAEAEALRKSEKELKAKLAGLEEMLASVRQRLVPPDQGDGA